MQADPAPDPHPNGGDFALANPDPGQPLLAFPGKPVISKGLNQHGFQRPHVPVQILAPGPQIQNRVTDELAWAMIGGLTAAAHLNDRMLQPIRFPEAALVRQPANRVDRFVFEQEELVPDGPGDPVPDGLFLQIQGLRIRHPAQPSCLDHICSISNKPWRALLST